jgi:hypothetical protein
VVLNGRRLVVCLLDQDVVKNDTAFRGTSEHRGLLVFEGGQRRVSHASIVIEADRSELPAAGRGWLAVSVVAPDR